MANITHITVYVTVGIFPDKLKLAKVVPIYKSDNKHFLENYRPISILSVFSKIFEKLMYNHLLEFLDEHNIIFNKQFGFRPKYSTRHALITIVEKINKALDENKSVIGLYLDFRKAFYTVNHDILVEKLRKYGISGCTLGWIKNYLSNRRQYVLYDTAKSYCKPVKMGIPQGSNLGPLLFILYVNDFCNISTDFFSILFADDTNIFVEGKDLNNVFNMFNRGGSTLNHMA